MKKFKIIYVYSGYGEMSICGNSVLEEGKGLKSICKKLNRDNLKNMLESSIERGDKKLLREEWKEFFDWVNVNEEEDYGVVGGGEEGGYFVFGEGNEYFEKIDRNDKWSEEEWSEWLKFCNR